MGTGVDVGAGLVSSGVSVGVSTDGVGTGVAVGTGVLVGSGTTVASEPIARCFFLHYFRNSLIFSLKFLPGLLRQYILS